MTIPTDSHAPANNAAASSETAIAGELILNAGAAFSLPIIPAPLVVSFYGTDGTRAQLTVNKGRVTFEGDPDAAAEMFIEAVTRRHAEQWGAQQERLELAEAQLYGILTPQRPDDAVTAAGGRREGTRRTARGS